MAKKNDFNYAEPVDFFPEEIRKQFGLGEYANANNNEEDKEDKEINKDIRRFADGK